MSFVTSEILATASDSERIVVCAFSPLSTAF
jgi:hypothetical protein